MKSQHLTIDNPSQSERCKHQLHLAPCLSVFEKFPRTLCLLLVCAYIIKVNMIPSILSKELSFPDILLSLYLCVCDI